MLRYIVAFLLLGFAHGHSGEDDHAEDGHCSPPIEEGLIVTPFKRWYDHGEVIQISCQDGYEVKAKKLNSTCEPPSFFGMRSKFVPSISGSTCKESPGCRAPLALGLVVTPLKARYDLGETITISCVEGYERVGPAVHTCTRHEFYKGIYEADISLGMDSDISYTRNHFGFDDDAACVETSDCDILTREGLTMTPFKRTYTPGEEVSISCDEGYELMVANLTICLTTGSFIFQRLYYDDEHDEFSTENLCRKKTMCEYPNEPGVILTPKKSLYDIGEVVSLSCANGYVLKGEVKRTCQIDDGPLSWISEGAEFSPEVDDEVCEKIPTCKGPGQQRGLIITQRKDVYYEDDELQFSCAEGFTLVGPESAVCTEVFSITAITKGFKKLKFEPHLPKKLCKKNPACEPPRRSWLNYSPSKPSFKPGEKITLSCAEGYEFNMPDDVVECREVTSLSSIKTGFKAMRFRPRIPRNVCKKIPRCDTPAPQLGMILTPRKDVYYRGDEVEIVCAGGYELIGPSTSVCSQVRSITAISTGFKKMKFVPEIPDGVCREKEMEESPSETVFEP